MWIIAESEVGGLIWLAIFVLVMVINGIAALVKRVRESRANTLGQRPTHGSVAGPAGTAHAKGSAKNDDLSAFLASVRKAAGQQQRRAARQTQSRPAPTRVRQTPKPTSRPTPRPTPRPPQREAEEPIVIQPTVAAQSPAKRAAAEYVATAAHTSRTGWMDKLPKQPLKRAILLQTVLGAPASRRNAPNNGPIAQRR